MNDFLNFAILTASSSNQTKAFSLVNGELEKITSATAYDGYFKQCQASTMAELNAILNKLNAKQSLIVGTPHRPDGTALQVGEKVNLTTKAKPLKNAISRTQDNIKLLPYAGLMPFDIDGGVRSAQEAYDKLLAFIPELIGISALIRPSSSSFIHTSNGEQLTDGRGYHLYFAVKNVQDVQRIADILWARQWLAGYGFYKPNKPKKGSPSLLERGFYDESVTGQSERILFEAKPILHNGLIRNADERTIIIEGEILDTSIIQELAADDLTQVEQLKQQAKEATKPQLKQATKAAKRTYLTQNPNKPVRQALKEFKQLERKELTPDFVLHTAQGEKLVCTLTVKDDGLTLCDPYEPDLDGGNTCKAKFYFNNGIDPIIKSFAHGGIFYTMPFISQQPDPALKKQHPDFTQSNFSSTQAETVTHSVAIEDDHEPTADGEYPKKGERPCYKVYEKWTKKPDGSSLRAGVYFHGIHTDKKTGEQTEVDSWICSPLYIEAMTLDQYGNNFGRYLHFKAQNGKWRKWCMPMSLLKGSCEELRGELLNMGVKFDVQDRRDLISYLTWDDPTTTLEITTQTGWHKEAYILPERCIGSDKYFYQSESTHDIPYRQSGSLTDWQDNIARYCVDNPLLTLSVCTAFAGALLKSAHQTGGGFHVFGGSSKGKTTGLTVACSVFGDETFKRSWKATSNGMESIAALHNDSLLALDEISECDPKEVEAITYAIGNGVGKSRANRNGGSRATYQWKVMCLSNGERSISETIKETGKHVKAGAEIRLLSVPVFGNYGAFNSLHDKPDGRALSDHLQTASYKYYGVAGIEYLERLVAEDRSIDDMAKQYTDKLINGENLSSQEARAATRFALVALAGELATEYGITGWNRGDACKGVKECFMQWRNHFGGGDTEDRQIKEAIQAYVELYGDARFTNTNDDTRLHGMRSGYWKDDVNGRTWLFSKSGLLEATKGYDLKKVLAVLKSCGWLIIGGEGRDATKVRIRNNETGETRFYCICFSSTTDIEKNTGTMGTTGTVTNDAAYSVPKAENETGTTGTESQPCSQSSQTGNTSGNATSHAAVGRSQCSQSSHEKNNIQSENENEKNISRPNVMVI